MKTCPTCQAQWSHTMVIAQTPIPQPRPRCPTGRPYNPAEYKTWKEEAAWLLHQQARRNSIQQHTGPVATNITIRPNGWDIQLQPSQIHRPPKLRGDLDGIIKATLDALQDSAIIVDDRQIVAIHAHFQQEPT